MGSYLWLVLAAIVIASASPTAALADVEGCKGALHQFGNDRTELKSSLVRYYNCIARSDGRDDCATEFQAIQTNHDDFEFAVSEYGSTCVSRPASQGNQPVANSER
jgi:hypothetical protein